MIVHNESGHDTSSAGSGRATGAVQVGLLFRWRVDVDHQGHVKNINPACRNVGGHEDSGPAGAELLNGPGAGALALVTVEGDSVDTIASDFFQLAVNRVFGSHEHDDFGAPGGGIDSQLLDDGITGGAITHTDGHVLHCVNGGFDCSGGMFHRIAHELFNQFPDIPVEGGGKQQPLTIRGG